MVDLFLITDIQVKKRGFIPHSKVFIMDTMFFVCEVRTGFWYGIWINFRNLRVDMLL